MIDKAADAAADSTRPVTTTELTPAEQLHALMVAWRERLDPNTIPELTTKSEGRRRTAKVTQADMALLTGVTELWYGKLERGARANYSDLFLARVAQVLRLSYDERRVFYYLTQGRPAPPLHPPASTEITAGLEQMIDSYPYPAWMSDRAWDILVLNDHMRRWLPHVEHERNVMRWVWTYAQAQTQLVDYDTVWAPRMLAQLRAANARWAGDRRLSAVIEEALRVNPLARRLWDTEPTVYVHPDGDVRQLHVPFQNHPITVEIIALAPMRNSEWRVVTLIPLTGLERPG